MARYRGLAAGLGLPLVVLVDGLAWWGMRATLVLHLYDNFGMAVEDAGELMATMTVGTLVASLVGGVLALAVGPLATLLIGLLVVAVGMVTLGLAPSELVAGPILILAFGRGLTRTSLYAAAAVALPFPRDGLRDALCVALWGAMNVAATGASLVAGAANAALSDGTLYIALSGLPLLGAVVVVGLLVVELLARREERAAEIPDADDPVFEGGSPLAPALPQTRRFDVRVLLAAAGVVAVALVPWAGYGVFFQRQWTLTQALGDDHLSMHWLFTLNPMVVVAVAVVLVPTLIVLHALKVRLPALLPVGLGLVLMAAAGATLLVAPLDNPTIPLLGGLVALAVAEVLVGPLLLSRIGGGQHWRLVTLVLAVWLAAGDGVRLAVDGLAAQGEPLVTGLGWGMVGACVVSGVLLAAAAFPARRWFAPRDAGSGPGHDEQGYDEDPRDVSWTDV